MDETPNGLVYRTRISGKNSVFRRFLVKESRHSEKHSTKSDTSIVARVERLRIEGRLRYVGLPPQKLELSEFQKVSRTPNGSYQQNRVMSFSPLL